MPSTRHWTNEAPFLQAVRSTGISEDLPISTASVEPCDARILPDASRSPLTSVDSLPGSRILLELGTDHVYLHCVGRNQRQFIEAFGPKLSNLGA